MRIPLTKYGLPQVVILPAAIIVVMASVALATRSFLQAGIIITIEILLGIILIWVLSFFRDPKRSCPSDSNILLAPADGRITDIELIKDHPAFPDEQGTVVLRVGIFLSIFNTHINRAPCNVKVEKITYKKGKYKNALNPQSARVNESNELCLIRTDRPQDRLIVRQISGAIARRIVCDTTEGSQLAGGEKFGMLKFGSRTELFLPLHENAKCLVKTGDKVKAGLTPLVKYE
ncbi:MAG: phosphatidylserine decarboxylase family protein [Sedimentisphaerales bacterium]|nr:phosphatidylserine decarboxylase family protein [Sedimentisphaerales bacterium]